MNALLRRLRRLELGMTSRPAPRPDEPARVVCGRCGLLVETACWHDHCPLTRRPAR